MSVLRTFLYDGIRWSASPSGFMTQYVGDEFGVVFQRVDDSRTDVRFSRYSPAGSRSREASFTALSDAALVRLLLASQSSVRAPEGGYRS
jgi:hypothetical protein